MRSGLIDRWAARMLGRAESRSIADTVGGLIVDCKLIWHQSMSIVIMMLVDVLLLLLWLWSLPSVIWQYALYAAYFAVSIAICVSVPRTLNKAAVSLLHFACAEDDIQHARRAMWSRLPVISSGARLTLSLSWLIVVVIAVIVAFSLYTQEPIQRFALSFFGLEVPACQVWVYALACLLPLGVFVMAKGRGIIGVLLVIASLYGFYLMATTELTAPGLMFYTTTFVIVFCLWFGTFWAIGRFIKEVRDEYLPKADEESDTLGDIINEFRPPTFASSPRQGGGKPLEM